MRQVALYALVSALAGLIFFYIGVSMGWLYASLVIPVPRIELDFMRRFSWAWFSGLVSPRSRFAWHGARPISGDASAGPSQAFLLE
jgi:hypothetical protein